MSALVPPIATEEVVDGEVLGRAVDGAASMATRHGLLRRALQIGVVADGTSAEAWRALVETALADDDRRRQERRLDECWAAAAQGRPT